MHFLLYTASGTFVNPSGVDTQRNADPVRGKSFGLSPCHDLTAPSLCDKLIIGSKKSSPNVSPCPITG